MSTSIFVSICFLCVPMITSAEYTPLADGLSSIYQNSDSFGVFFNALFEIALTIGSVLAVLLIAVSGLQYMTTDAVSGKTSSKERMQQAILGLLMLLGVWLFFNEINPNILNLNLTLETGSAPITTTPVTPREDVQNIYPNYTNETWTPINPGDTCSSEKGEGWVAVRESRCPGVSPYGAGGRDCCALNPDFVSDAHSKGTTYPPSERRNLPSGSWCYVRPNSSSNCFSSQNACTAGFNSDPDKPQGGCGLVQ